jgi:hypothetical protein
MGFTTSYANTILTNAFSNCYIALLDSSGNEVSTTGTGYKRAATSGGSFTASNGKITNGAYIYYPEAQASWGTITQMALYTAVTGGDKRYQGALTAAVPVAADTVPLFKPNAINISLDVT